jgi:hypothetical protein
MADDPSQWTPRVDGVDPESLGDREQKAFDGQRKKWGEPLSNHLIYARVPEILHGAQGMWRGLGSARRLESTLPPLLNRRVAILNGCVF